MEEKKEYVQLWLSYAALFEPYSDGEVGRLVLAMMKYKSSGVEPGFTGNERYVWPAIKRDIDAAAAKQAELTEKNRKNGTRGGRPAKEAEPTGLSKNPENPLGFSETQKSKGKEKEKGQEKEKILPPTPLRGFDEFWTAYPRKQSKAAARKAFERLHPDSELLGVMLSAVKRQRESPQWQRDGGQYIPHASTWINGHRWEDEDTGHLEERSFDLGKIRELMEANSG